MNVSFRALLPCLLLTSAVAPAYAEDSSDLHPYLTTKYYTNMGVYFPDKKLKIGVDGTLGDENPSLEFEEDVRGDQSDQVFAFDFVWRFGEKWSLQTQAFSSSQAKSATLEDDVEWGDYIFEAGANVTAKTEFDLARVFFGRSFSSDERHDYGVGLGFHWLEFGASIRGEATINGMDTGIRRESVSAAAPLPNIGAWYLYSISSRWAVNTRLDWFGASFDEYDGSLVNIGAGLNYKVSERFGVGLSYNVVELKLDIDKTNWHGSISTRYSGPFLDVSIYW